MHFPGHGGQQVLTGVQETESTGSQSQRQAKDQSTSFTSSFATKRPSSWSGFLRCNLGGCEVSRGKAAPSSAGPDAGREAGRVAPGGAGVLPPRDPRGRGGGRGGKGGGVEGAGRRLRVPGSRRSPTAAPLRPRPGAGGRRGAPAPRPHVTPAEETGAAGGGRRQTGAALGAHGWSSSSASSCTQP